MTVDRVQPYYTAMGVTRLAAVVDEELLVHHPVIGLHAAVKELRCDVILDAVGLAAQLELQCNAQHTAGRVTIGDCRWQQVTGAVAAAYQVSN
jgi:hypothetical protein